MKTTEKIKVYKISVDSGFGWLCIEHHKDVLCAIEEEVKELPIGESLTIEAIEMTREELENLPEFEGW